MNSRPTYTNTETGQVVEVVEIIGNVVRVRSPRRPGLGDRNIPAAHFAAYFEEN
jgi:hypothetical protein